MMFLIHESLETQIDIEGTIYNVDLSFNNVIKFFDLIDDSTLFETEKVVFGTYLLLKTALDYDMDSLAKIFKVLVTKFIYLEEESKIKTDLEGNPMPVSKSAQVYDLKQDASYIYASFMQAYNIDLIEVQNQLDWRKFQALLIGLPEDTIFKQVIDIRKRPYPKGKHASEERAKLKRLKNQYAL